MADLTRSLLDVELDSENDCVVVLGDRYELIPIVAHCFMRNIKVLHFCGGDRTEIAKTDFTIYFSEFEYNTGSICKTCYHANAKQVKAI